MRRRNRSGWINFALLMPFLLTFVFAGSTFAQEAATPHEGA
jgi:hypothetical protein